MLSTAGAHNNRPTNSSTGNNFLLYAHSILPPISPPNPLWLCVKTPQNTSTIHIYFNTNSCTARYHGARHIYVYLASLPTISTITYLRERNKQKRSRKKKTTTSSHNDFVNLYLHYRSEVEGIQGTGSQIIT